ncbi:ubiquitin-like-conjugating enzyme ATG10 isoform X1 [Harpegnathos saltator]|nr:ubiquitin-like-conjugating enzyme ATG10 isoform X1 [Harpegnathos saltator]
MRKLERGRERERELTSVFPATMDGPGTFTWEEFVANAKEFLALSDELRDRWEFCGNQNIPGQAYLVKKSMCFVRCDEDVSRKKDDNFLSSPHFGSEVPIVTEHHILWSMSYSVPVLYFNGWKSGYPDMKPVNVDEARMAHSLQLNYMELSQAIHPIIGTPFLQLHPCQSQELIRNMPNSKNKLVSWLSCVASAALNLNVNSEYYKLTAERTGYLGLLRQ